MQSNIATMSMYSLSQFETPSSATSKPWCIVPCLIVMPVIIVAIALLTGCQKQPEYAYLHGETMGTSYHIRYQPPGEHEQSDIQAAIDRRLDEINASMSTYIDSSTISEFNRRAVNKPISIEADFIKVLHDARLIYQRSGGAFDPTVMPLVELWGFGSQMRVDRLQNPPSAEQIAAARSLVDFDAIHFDGNQLSKTKQGVALDFSAIAKGYGVDVIAEVMKQQYHIDNYMVEIGGEVATSGVNDRGQAWQIAIDAPVLSSTVSDRQSIAILRQPLAENQTGNMHIATSGNYRNSITFDGIRYSHTIDPTSGKPIVGGAPSVTVAAESVALADGWATALTAMPYDKALTTAKQQQLAVMFVIAQPSHDLNQSTDNTAVQWQLVATPAMQALLVGKAASNE